MREGFGLRLCTGGSCESGLGFCGGSGMGEEIDFVGDGAAEVIAFDGLVLGHRLAFRAQCSPVGAQSEVRGFSLCIRMLLAFRGQR